MLKYTQNVTRFYAQNSWAEKVYAHTHTHVIGKCKRRRRIKKTTEDVQYLITSHKQ